MAPKARGATEPTKQRSLTSFFGNGTAVTPKSKVKSSKPSFAVTPSSDASNHDLRTPESWRASSRAPNSAGSHVSTRCDTSPPTSDSVGVDVELVSEEERLPKTRKRKIVLIDSEESDDCATDAKLTTSPLSPKVVKKKKRIIKHEHDADHKISSEPLGEFKGFPAKRETSRSRIKSSDDDNFIVASDSDGDVRSIKSLVSQSSASSRRSGFNSDDSDDGERRVSRKGPKSKSKSKSKGKTGRFHKDPDNSSCPNGLFLTSAEKREQEKKEEKKTAETPYSFLDDVKDREGRRPGDPNYDPRTLYIPPKAWKEFTPFEKQFWEIKQDHYDTILFFQKGKFLELYEDDARIGHQEFDLKLTSRVKMSMVGVPEMSFNFWAAKFLGKGYKVGRVDQSETALGAEMRLAADKSKKNVGDKGKDKIVRRELNKVYTNGTLVDPELLTDEQAGHCISIVEVPDEGNPDNVQFGVCVLDSSTSQFDMSSFKDDVCRTKLETLMRQLRPKELLIEKGNLSVITNRLLKAILPASCLWTALRTTEGFDYDETLRELRNLFPAGEEDAEDEETAGSLPGSVPETIRSMLTSRPAIKALGTMIWYLRQLNIDKEILSMKNFNVHDPVKNGQNLILDGQTLAHVEVLLNNEGKEDGSLLKLLGRCITPSGKRLFRIWLSAPLKKISDINDRLDAVQDLMDHSIFETDFNEVAKGLPDLERIVSRIHAKSCGIKDFLKILTAFKKLSLGLGQLADQAESFKSKAVLGLLRSAPDVLPNIKNIQDMYVKPSGEKGEGEELIPREGQDPAYDEIMAQITGLEEELEEDLKKLEKRVGCKLSYWHSHLGTKEIYLVETSANQKAIPDDWIKSGSTKAKARWVVRSLQGNVRQLKEARENRNTAIKEFKYRLFEEFDRDRAEWLRAVRVLAELDCLLSLAKASNAIGEPVCRPEFEEGETAWLDFQELRHPVLNLSTFIPNDVKLGGDVGRVTLLTGPNMAGKSTLMRMTATAVIMAQLGMLIPATKARLCPVDRIITRMGAYDSMFSSASTFKVELDECCKILRDATPQSLVILDELGRGTSTFDGMAIAGAVLHEIATHTMPLSIFATHYAALTDDFLYHPNIRNMYMSTIVDDERRDIVFLFKLVEGVATSSFGTHVANLAGVPFSVVERAEVVSKEFSRQFKERMDAKQKSGGFVGKMGVTAQADFVYLYKIGTGRVGLPEGGERRKLVLAGLKRVVKGYFEK